MTHPLSIVKNAILGLDKYVKERYNTYNKAPRSILKQRQLLAKKYRNLMPSKEKVMKYETLIKEAQQVFSPKKR